MFQHKMVRAPEGHSSHVTFLGREKLASWSQTSASLAAFAKGGSRQVWDGMLS